jgi:hypothetical protein
VNLLLCSVEIFNPDQAFDLYGPKNKACGFSSYANMKLTAAYNVFVAVRVCGASEKCIFHFGVFSIDIFTPD